MGWVAKWGGCIFLRMSRFKSSECLGLARFRVFGYLLGRLSSYTFRPIKFCSWTGSSRLPFPTTCAWAPRYGPAVFPNQSPTFLLSILSFPRLHFQSPAHSAYALKINHKNLHANCTTLPNCSYFFLNYSTHRPAVSKMSSKKYFLLGCPRLPITEVTTHECSAHCPKIFIAKYTGTNEFVKSKRFMMRPA